MANQSNKVAKAQANNVRYNTYTPEQEITAFIAYRLEGHNASATERVTGIPAATILRWVKRWKEEGFEPGNEAWMEQTFEGFAGKAVKIRDKALARLEKEIDNTSNVGQLMTVVDKLDNKVRLTAGQATSIVEERKIDAEQISAALAKYIEEAAQATIERHEIVYDADKFEEQVLGIEAKSTPETK